MFLFKPQRWVGCLLLLSSLYAGLVQAHTLPCTTITHLGGQSCVPPKPQRIVALGAAEIDSLLALDVQPIGIGSFSGRDFTGFSYLESQLAASTIIGRFTRPNLEAILRLKPDLILLSRQVPSNYPLLSQIAPTVVLPDAKGQWRTQLRQVAKVVDRSTQAEHFIDQQDSWLQQAKTQLQQAQVGSVAFVRFTAKEYRLYGDQRIAGPWLYQDLGLTQPKLIQTRAAGKNYVNVSLEELPQLDAEVMLLLDQSGRHPLLDSRWLKPIPAIAHNRVLSASRDLWITPAPLAAQAASAQLLSALLELYP